MKLETLNSACEKFLKERMSADPAHDISHVRRVVKNTMHLTVIEEANRMVTIPAAWLHDCVSVAKDSRFRQQASRLAAREGVKFLESIKYPAELIDEVFHAIEAHSFSANVETRSLEAKIVQDADRLEALGAIGIARCMLTGGSMGTALYEANDPFCERRDPDDRTYTLDHFYAKLFTLPATMKTEAGRVEAEKRVEYMKDFLQQLGDEIKGRF